MKDKETGKYKKQENILNKWRSIRHCLWKFAPHPISLIWDLPWRRTISDWLL